MSDTKVRTYSPLQERIFEFVTCDTGNASIEAVAGSGKTTTIVEAANRLPANTRSLFLAFNKSIAEELASRLPANVTARTLNSLGHGAWTRLIKPKRVQLDSNKTRRIIDDTLTDAEAKMYGSVVSKLVSLAKSAGIVPQGINQGATGLLEDNQQVWRDMMEWHDIELQDERADPEYAIDLARDVLRQSIKHAWGRVIDFDDQLYMTVIYGAPIEKYDFVFVDEAQDLNPIQHRLLAMALKPDTGRLIAVGDPCQPTGTMVDVVVKSGTRWELPTIDKRPIDTVAVGDTVVSLSPRDRQWCRNKKILGITKRPYSGALIRIETDRHTSRYTPNHHCLASFAPLRNLHCVYLMQKGEHFRVGKAKMDYGESGTGIVCRMWAERADAVWILSVHPDSDAALLAETITATEYGIPELVFTNKAVWKEIPTNKERARTCLQAFGRYLQYPLFAANYEPDGLQRFEHANYVSARSLKRPMVVHAANLMDGCLMLPYDHGSDPINARGQRTRIALRSEWIPIAVSREHYEGDVYSMDIEDDHTYVADGLVTHNCQAIYGFRGADSASMDNLQKTFKTVTLPLSISYRCPQLVVQEAQKIVQHIESSPTAPVGKVESLDKYTADTFLDSDAIICRNAKPLIELAFKLIRAGRGCRVLGRDIGVGLQTLIKKMNAKDVDHLEKKLDAYLDRETAKYMDKRQEEKAATLADKIETIRVFIDQLGEDERTIEALYGKIDSLFTDNGKGKLTLCTVHKSKGLEWDRVFILNRHLMPSRYAVQEWQIAQETNIHYVAITRAKAELYYIQGDDFQKPVETKPEEIPGTKTFQCGSQEMGTLFWAKEDAALAVQQLDGQVQRSLGTIDEIAGIVSSHRTDWCDNDVIEDVRTLKNYVLKLQNALLLANEHIQATAPCLIPGVADALATIKVNRHD